MIFREISHNHLNLIEDDAFELARQLKILYVFLFLKNLDVIYCSLKFHEPIINSIADTLIIMMYMIFNF